MLSCAKAEQFSFSLHVNAMKFKPRWSDLCLQIVLCFHLLFCVNPPDCVILSPLPSSSHVFSFIFLSWQVCMDILCNIIRCTQPPLSEPLLNSVFPVVVSTILASDDNSVLQVQTWVQGSLSRTVIALLWS